jgi:HK97 family phage portal protein
MIARALRARYGQVTKLSTPDEWLVSAFGGTTAASGVAVSPDTALNSTAVLASVERLSRTVASLPLIVYRRLPDGGKERAREHPLYTKLHDLPNEEHTALEFRQFQMASLLLRGNSYSYIDRSGGGDVLQLWPLRPNRVTVERVGGQLFYHWAPLTAPERTFPRSQIHHIRGLSTNGITGLSPISLAAEAVGLGLAAEEFGARFFSNDATPPGALRHPSTLSQPAQDRLKESFEQAHAPLAKKHKMALFEEGMDWVKIGVDPKESQFLETRKFQVREVARFFNIQPHFIGDLEDATFSNIESQGIEFVVYTLRFWLMAIEQAITRDLFRPDERESYFAEFLVDALLRGDVAARGQFYQALFNMGAISPNEIRGRENMNPYPGGDQRFVQLNLVPVELAGEAGALGAGARGGPIRSTAGSAERRAQGARPPARRALRPAFTRMFTDATARVFRSERQLVMAAARKHLLRRDAVSFDRWLEEFYTGDAARLHPGEHEGYVKRQIAPVIAAYAEAVGPGVAQELGVDFESDAEMERYLDDVAAAHAGRHVRSSLGQLRVAMGEKPEAPIEALEERFDHWDEVRAERIGKRAGVQVGEAVAKFVMLSAGFRLVWNVFGDACEICAPFDGMTISAGGSFVKAGDTIPAGAGAPLTVSSNITTPPLHDGCDCGIGPG